jgi:CRP-like cAMP-binding protein
MSSSIISILSFQTGETIFREGQVGRMAYLVQEGRVKIQREKSLSQKQVIGHAGPGQVFGEHALLSIGPRQNSAIAEQPTKCVAIHRDKLTAKLKTEDAFIAALYNILATNMRSMIDKGADLDCLLQDLSEGTRTLASTGNETAAQSSAPAKDRHQDAAEKTGEADEDGDDAFLI